MTTMVPHVYSAVAAGTTTAVKADWNRDGVVDWRDPWVVTGNNRLPAWGGAWAADWNRDGIIDWRDGWAAPVTTVAAAPVRTVATAPVATVPVTTVAAPITTVGAAPFAWNDDWVVRDGWRGAYDWNRDGIIDWRDDLAVSGLSGFRGDWVRADWNRDGVIDWKDGWRRLGGDWNVLTRDPSWRGNGWHPETISVKEVPTSASLKDTEWRTFEYGPQVLVAPAHWAPAAALTSYPTTPRPAAAVVRV
eukprot:CAMPEP_0168339872 /NCGR_PEP_ID=MMETSP0213-20121227/13726_1 /TAXON_ID=151035 /ORGANISM="Euplotes harpa, Strain FSP1.4" /LENGTH=246 /DNA_ID=CAMNT_0008345999 /DNA_START=35 /DNA_END=775 /DNA_ORIENTATION=+